MEELNKLTQLIIDTDRECISERGTYYHAEQTAKAILATLDGRPTPDSQWTRVEDGLPEEEGKYLIAFPSGGDIIWTKAQIVRHKELPISWYGPLPQPPKEGI